MSHEARRPVPEVPTSRYPRLAGGPTDQPSSSLSDEATTVAAGEDHAVDLRIRVEEIPGETVVVHVGGEVDLSTASTLHEQLMHACARADRQRVRVDLGDVDFLGSAGLQVLLGAHSLCRRCGVGFEVSNPPRAAFRAIQISGLDKVLSVLSDAEVERGAG